jgi:hypothetical protein
MYEMPFEYKIMKKIHQLDPRVFPECMTKQVEIGFFRKRMLFIHRYPDQWSVLQVIPELKSYIFKLAEEERNE